MLTITVQTASWTEHLTDVERHQIPFATAKAIDRTAKDFQAFQIKDMHSVFTVRQDTWFDRSVKITHFATKTELWETIAIQPPGTSGTSRSDIVSKFEDETEKVPFRGSHVAVPTSFLKRNKKDIIPANMRMSALNFHRVGNRIIGDRRTFIVKSHHAGVDVVLQRTGFGRGRGTVSQAIYLLVPRVRIKPDLHFARNVDTVVNLMWQPNFEAAFAAALATAK